MLAALLCNLDSAPIPSFALGGGGGKRHHKVRRTRSELDQLLDRVAGPIPLEVLANYPAEYLPPARVSLPPPDDEEAILLLLMS